VDGEHAMNDHTSKADPSRARICFVVSSPMTAIAFLTHHIRVLSERYAIDLVVNADPDSIRHPDLRRAGLYRAHIVRTIAPLADLRALVQLARILRRGRYAAVHSMTPKAGLLTALAAYLTRVPMRVHTYTGQVWATRTGAHRWVLRQLDRVIARLNTHVLADSASQLAFLRAQHVLAPGAGEMIGSGSVAGIDPGRFAPSPGARSSVRSELEKGVLELAHAFERIARGREDRFLLLVGPDEDDLTSQIADLASVSRSQLRFVGWTDQPERYLAASDVFCLPSHREGFGSVILEAAAAGLPAIGSRIYGITDAIEDNVTGVLVECGNAVALARAMERLAQDELLRKRLGDAARARALREYSQDALSFALASFYERNLPLDGHTAQPERPRSGFDGA
jgi:glycosyltransferase involved in cell wall biosynthesis